jgi:uncharacterized protein (DUF433 family)
LLVLADNNQEKDIPYRVYYDCTQGGISMDYHEYITRDDKVCGGEPVIKGTRVTLRTILARLAEGASIEELLEDFPSLKEQHVRAVIAFAATSAEEDLPIKGLPRIS